MRLLLVEDDVMVASGIKLGLSEAGYAVDWVGSGERAQEVLQKETFDIAVVDIGLPGMDGLALLRHLRRPGMACAAMPVLMLTARGDDMDRIVGLELGADDYVPKPCLPRELAARLRAILRRSGQSGEPPNAPLVFGALSVRPEQRRVEWEGAAVELTSTEYALVEVLARHGGRPVSKGELSELALGRPLARFDRSIDVHLSSIRHKLGTLADGRSCIQTVYRQGYQLIRE